MNKSHAAGSFTINLDQEVVAGKEGPLHPEGVTVSDFELREFLYRDEKYITGKKLQKRAGELDENFGLHTAEYLLEHQEEIPHDWRGKYFIFPATELRYSDGCRCVPYLYWDDGRWLLGFRWHDDKFGSDDRLMAVRA